MRLRIARRSQLGEFFRWIFFLQNRFDIRLCFATRDAIVLFGSIEHFDVFTELAIKTCFGFLAQRAFGDQRLHHRRHFVVRMPRIVRQAIFHGVDDMGQRVQAHHVGGAEGGTLGTPEQRACQGIHLVEAQSMRFSMMHRCKN